MNSSTLYSLSSYVFPPAANRRSSESFGEMEKPLDPPRASMPRHRSTLLKSRPSPRPRGRTGSIESDYSDVSTSSSSSDCSAEDDSPTWMRCIRPRASWDHSDGAASISRARHRLSSPPPSPPTSHVSRSVRRVELLFLAHAPAPPPRTFPRLPPPPELEAIPAFHEPSPSASSDSGSEDDGDDIDIDIDEDDEICFDADGYVDGAHGRRVRFMVPPNAKLDPRDEWTKDDGLCLVDFLLCY
ncbi:hypothetical protein MKEN_00552800 [Mycena kentingensis (nom. inval.)]|nr:hypothetical protein MKEN_00552800 [Mycena kentingensis (nom. inval.)]